VALEQLGRNSQDLSGLRTELNSEHQSQLDTREATLQAQETELRGTHPNPMLIINIVYMAKSFHIIWKGSDSMIFLHGPLLEVLIYQLMKLPMHYDCVPSIMSLFCTFFDLCSSCIQRG